MAINTIKRHKGAPSGTVAIGPLRFSRAYLAVAAGSLVLLYLLLMGYIATPSMAPRSAAGLRIDPPPMPDVIRRNPDLKHILSKTREMQIDVADFWLLHGPDFKHGGFYATLDRQGKPASPSYKGLIQQVCGHLRCGLVICICKVAHILDVHHLMWLQASRCSTILLHRPPAVDQHHISTTTTGTASLLHVLPCGAPWQAAKAC